MLYHEVNIMTTKRSLQIVLCDVILFSLLPHHYNNFDLMENQVHEHLQTKHDHSHFN